MCGIVGYVGNTGRAADHGALDVILEGLRRLEYRGYDSAGLAVVTDAGIDSRKKAGKLANLVQLLEDEPLPAALTGIGHTRWATHGGPTDVNAHPHLADEGNLAMIHNGIIENFAELKAKLRAQGVECRQGTPCGDDGGPFVATGVAVGALPVRPDRALVQDADAVALVTGKACVNQHGAVRLTCSARANAAGSVFNIGVRPRNMAAQ